MPSSATVSVGPRAELAAREEWRRELSRYLLGCSLINDCSVRPCVEWGGRSGERERERGQRRVRVEGGEQSAESESEEERV